MVAKNAIRHLADFKGKKIRIFASEFQSASFKRLGTTPVAMSPGDVMTALQQGSLDASVAGVELLSGLHFYDAAKYITMTNLAAIFYLVELSKKCSMRCRRICSRSSRRTPPAPSPASSSAPTRSTARRPRSGPTTAAN